MTEIGVERIETQLIHRAPVHLGVRVGALQMRAI
jgi:hypothetical protein